jgi:hypothetical protein
LIGGVEGEPELLVSRDLGVIEEGAMEGGDGDAVSDCAVLTEIAGAVQVDAVLPPSAPGRGDVYRTDGARSELPERNCRLVAQDRLGTTSQDGCHQVPKPGQPFMADCVNTAVHREKSIRLDPASDRVRPISQVLQLPTCHHPVLPSGKGSKPTVTWLSLMPSTGINVVHVSHARDVARNRVTRGSRRATNVWL